MSFFCHLILEKDTECVKSSSNNGSEGTTDWSVMNLRMCIERHPLKKTAEFNLEWANCKQL